MKNIITIIVSAGKGIRLGHETPKQYLKLGPKMVLEHTIDQFYSHPLIGSIQLVMAPDHIESYWPSLQTKYPHLLPPVVGGETRSDSVRLGLEAIRHKNPSHVLIHDAARPFIEPHLITNLCTALQSHTCVAAGYQAVDSLKTYDGTNSTPLDRNKIWHAQTPQGFEYQLISTLHESNKNQSFSDDLSLAEASKLPVHFVQSSPLNFKITNQADLIMAQTLVNSSYETRTAMGIDVHKTKPANHITLGGIIIPSPFGLEGHSDADVGLHAITDALLGALSLGDIGTHFPPSDPQWKDADSSLFLLKAHEFLTERQGRITHIDLTFICEEPKINKYSLQMQERIGSILKCPRDRISIKATTSERLGFTGRGEGIMAQAIATIEVPRV